MKGSVKLRSDFFKFILRSNNWYTIGWGPLSKLTVSD